MKNGDKIHITGYISGIYIDSDAIIINEYHPLFAWKTKNHKRYITTGFDYQLIPSKISGNVTYSDELDFKDNIIKVNGVKYILNE